MLSTSEENMAKSRSKVVTIMMIDIVGYTRLTSRLDRDQFELMNEKFDELALPIFSNYHGWVVKKIGDCFLVVFESATDALLCGIDLQNKFHEYNQQKPKVPLSIKVAINNGEVLLKDNDIYGEPVNAVARIEKETKPGQIYFSGAVYLAMNKGEIPHVFVGKKMMKGLKHPVSLFRVKWAGEDKARRRKQALRGLWSAIKWLIALAILGTAGWYAFNYLKTSGLI
jgi:class 3 adenylate cyclase